MFEAASPVGQRRLQPIQVGQRLGQTLQSTSRPSSSAPRVSAAGIAFRQSVVQCDRQQAMYPAIDAIREQFGVAL
jgi:hypothetical protein